MEAISRFVLSSALLLCPVTSQIPGWRPVRAILTERLTPPAAERGLGSRIHARFAGLEGELQLPDRSDEPPRAAVFDP